MYIIGSILLIVVLVVAIRFMIKAAKLSPAIYAQYEGVFGKGTAVCFLCFCIGPMIVGVSLFISGFFYLILSKSFAEGIWSIIIGAVAILIGGAIFLFVMRGVRERCPEQMRDGLYRALFITTIGVFGGYCRYSWNIVCGIMSVIPGFGWMANFIITKDAATKKELVKAGEQWDRKYAEQENREKEKRQEEEERQRAEREEMEEDLRRKVWKEQGRTDVIFNSDSSKWRYSDEENWRKTKKK